MKRTIRRLDKIINKRFSTDSRVHQLWHHPAGPKTVFFWAPAWKWSLVVVGLSEMTRPASKISLNNSVSLGAGYHCIIRHDYQADSISPIQQVPFYHLITKLGVKSGGNTRFLIIRRVHVLTVQKLPTEPFTQDGTTGQLNHETPLGQAAAFSSLLLVQYR